MEWFKSLLKFAWTGYRAYNGDPQAAMELYARVRARVREVHDKVEKAKELKR